MTTGPSAGRRQLRVSAATIVYPDLVKDVFHVDPSCTGKAATASCAAGDAHGSRLVPCKICAGEVQAWLNTALGRIPSGEKKRRGLPHLNSWHTEELADRDPDDSADPLGPGQTTLGPSGDLKDARYANVDERGWGIRAFAQDPEEFLGGATDDDNDWRGASGTYLD